MIATMSERTPVERLLEEWERLEDWKRSHGVMDAEVPWWAVGLLDNGQVPPGSPLSHARSRFIHGRTPDPDVEYLTEYPRRAELIQQDRDAWLEVVELARTRIHPRTIEEWRERAWKQRDHGDERNPGGDYTRRLRRIALRYVPAFNDIVGLTNDDGRPIVDKPFHIRSVRAMRQKMQLVLLLPYEYGKSWKSSITVPLMDWCEWPQANEIRVYFNPNFRKKWMRRLQSIVEHNEALHQVFPWVRKPEKHERAHGNWSTLSFAIAGRDDPDFSILALTMQSEEVGHRAVRVGVDDVVNRKNAAAPDIQDKMDDYIRNGVLTMPRVTQRTSDHGTRWGTVFIDGTLYDENDVNKRFFEEWRAQGHASMRFDVFPMGERDRQRGVTIWPEERPIDVVEAQYARLGRRNFDLRVRNLVRRTGHQFFDVEDVEAALRPEFRWRVFPADASLLIGFDPGKGRKTKHSKNPAFVVYGLREEKVQFTPHDVRTTEWVHFVEWGRMEGVPFTRQCDQLIVMARWYQCPIAVEDNNQQVAYQDYIQRFAPDVKVICHTTSENKRDADDGIQTYVPLFENKRVLIHCGGADEAAVEALRREFQKYPSYRYTDIVLAAWIARYQHELRRRNMHNVSVRTGAMPMGMARFGRRRFISLREAKEASLR